MWQQYSTIRKELPFAVECLSGHYGCDLWTQSTWSDLLSKTDIVVCTAEILHLCLMRSFVRMESINLLIFDEAHHAKKKHPYAKIMQDYYSDNPRNAARPRIFGMTASPIDLEGDEADIEDCARQVYRSVFLTSTDLQ